MSNIPVSEGYPIALEQAGTVISEYLIEVQYPTIMSDHLTTSEVDGLLSSSLHLIRFNGRRTGPQSSTYTI